VSHAEVGPGRDERGPPPATFRLVVAFDPIRTERLILRPPVAEDAEAAFERRRLPEVARFQDWELPYTREQAKASMARAAAMDGPTDGEGWTITVVDAEEPDRILGDLYVELRWGGRTGMFGYTFHPDHWGQGYATEAAVALVRHLFEDLGVLRVESSLHPDNVASARVLEACGLLFEGRTRGSFWVGDERSDDALYGATSADWDAWSNRPRSRPEVVELVPLTPETSRAVAELAVHASQERFVGTVADLFREALVPPSRDGEALVPWCRAIDADGEIVGVLMTTEPTGAHVTPSVRCLLIDRLHQRRGVGTLALDQVEHRLLDGGSTSIETRWSDGPGTPGPFFVGRGFRPSGDLSDDDDGGAVHAVKALR